jgi:hypothetical protein
MPLIEWPEERPVVLVSPLQQLEAAVRAVHESGAGRVIRITVSREFRRELGRALGEVHVLGDEPLALNIARVECMVRSDQADPWELTVAGP